ncbi:hypothetical protein M9H77_07830 [Catharanthus roseus]|uniref:Uncharacterized protein n=1 Tax=Catharanthus roseus TaxID=4058 RepID=A0ACC0BW19_CATRO|nr:hypothetical protein M9H77_07830 [Catharanthus roseus]
MTGIPSAKPLAIFWLSYGVDSISMKHCACLLLSSSELSLHSLSFGVFKTLGFPPNPSALPLLFFSRFRYSMLLWCSSAYFVTFDCLLVSSSVISLIFCWPLHCVGEIPKEEKIVETQAISSKKEETKALNISTSQKGQGTNSKGPEIEAYKPKIPYLLALNRDRSKDKMRKYPNMQNILKEMLSRKRRIDKASTYTLGEECSAILINKEKLPQKINGRKKNKSTVLKPKKNFPDSKNSYLAPSPQSEPTPLPVATVTTTVSLHHACLFDHHSTLAATTTTILLPLFLFSMTFSPVLPSSLLVTTVGTDPSSSRYSHYHGLSSPCMANRVTRHSSSGHLSTNSGDNDSFYTNCDNPSPPLVTMSRKTTASASSRRARIADLSSPEINLLIPPFPDRITDKLNKTWFEMRKKSRIGPERTIDPTLDNQLEISNLFMSLGWVEEQVTTTSSDIIDDETIFWSGFEYNELERRWIARLGLSRQ